MSRGAEGGNLGPMLRRFVSRLDTQGKLDNARVVDVWDDVVGERVAKRTFVQGLREGELLVGVDSPAWANELTLMSDHLRERIEQEVGSGTVTSIRFTVSKTVEHERARGRAERASAGRYREDGPLSVPLDDNELAAIDRSVATIKDVTLREAVRRATVADLEAKKGLESSAQKD